MHSSLRMAGWRTTEAHGSTPLDILAQEGPEAVPVHNSCRCACPHQFCWWALDCYPSQHSLCQAVSLSSFWAGRADRGGLG